MNINMSMRLKVTATTDNFKLMFTHY